MEEKISELKDRSVKLIQSKQQKEKKNENSKDSLKDLWNTIKQINKHIIGVP